MDKNKNLETMANIVVAIFMIISGIGFYMMASSQRELMNQVIELQDQNSEITEQVDKLNKTIDSINAKRLKEVAEKNNVGG